MTFTCGCGIDCAGRRNSLASSHQQIAGISASNRGRELEVPVRKFIGAGALAFFGLMTTGVGISNADEDIFTGDDYASEAGCMADGPHFETSRPAPSGGGLEIFQLCV